jgi:PncC family amidohydrolase
MANQSPAKKIHNLLIDKKLTIAVAESCSGGLLAQLLTDLPGSSQYFLMGMVTYNNSSKKRFLGVPAHLLATHGAVSLAAAKYMALSVKKRAGADTSIAITGIAGPSGATQGKPIGTVFIAVTMRNRVASARCRFSGNRSSIRKQAAAAGLRLLYSLL